MTSESDAVELLEQAFRNAQPIAAEKARSIAGQVVAGDTDIAEAALSWARTGGMPVAPEIEGFSPARLAGQYRPTQVFTILLGLRRDPGHAKGMLRHYGKERGYRPRGAAPGPTAEA